MGYSFDCTCDWCGDVQTVEAKGVVVNLEEEAPAEWQTVIVSVTRNGLAEERLVLCQDCYTARANALLDAESYLDKALADAKAERIILARMTDEKRRKVERQAYADGR